MIIINPPNPKQKTKGVKQTMKKHKLIPAIILALILSLTCIVPAFAESAFADGILTDPGDIGITKVLKMPIGTTTPDVTFTFSIQKKMDPDKLTSGDTFDAMPDLGPMTITFGADDTGNTPAGSDVKTVKKQSAAILSDSNNWPCPGEFVYTITELSTGSYAYECGEVNPYEEMYYSYAEYTLRVYVDTELNVVSITCERAKDDAGEDAEGKVDPTLGDGETNFSEMTFANTYIKTNDPDFGDDPPEDGEVFVGTPTLSVSNTTDGTYGDKNFAFQYDVTINANSLVDDGRHYTAYKLDKDGKVVGSAIDFTDRVTVTVYLKDGESLAFIDTPVGTSYTASDVEPTNYDPKYKLNGGSDVPGETSVTLTTPDTYILDTPTANKADFTNSRDGITTTGLNLKDLPFIGLIAFAAIGIAAVVISKSRKSKHSAAAC